MRTSERSYVVPPIQAAKPEKHVFDYLRVLHKRRWVAAPVFLAVFVFGAVNALRQTPIYQARTQMLIEKDAPNVATLDQMFQSNDGWMEDDFYQTQYRILQSRTLAKRTIDAMKLWDAPRLGNGPVPKSPLSITGLIFSGVYGVIDLARKPFADAPVPATTTAADETRESETSAQAGRIDEFLGGLSVVPIRNSRLVEIRYNSTDPKFAAQAANAVAQAYIQQNLEFKFNTSKEATDWLSNQLAEQRKTVEANEAALQAFRERNGTVAAPDSASNIVVARLTDLNTALTRAKTERISKESLYNQLKSAEAAGNIDSVPAILSNDYVQKLRSDLADLQRQQAQLAERYGPRHAEMIKIRTAVESADAKLKVEISKVVDAVKNDFQAAQAQERSLQEALDAQKGEAMSLNRRGIEASVLQRELDSNRQIYETLLQRTKETGISSERKTTNVRVIDPAETPGGPISPNVPRDLMMALAAALVFGVGLAFGVEQLDSRIHTPQQMKEYLDAPFLGMVPLAGPPKTTPENPLIGGSVTPGFAEAFKALRTSILFSSAEGGMRSVVVTSSGPGEGKSIISANIAISLAQAGQRVLLMDADMRRPRVHEIFGTDQEPGLSNVLTGNAKASDAIRRSPNTPNLWLLGAGHIPPNPAELLGSHRYRDFMGSLDEHFDWVIVDSPPILVVTDASIVAHQASGTVFVVNADKTPRQAARNAIDQLHTANAHVIGTVLNRVDLQRNPYSYSAYYKKEYSKYYIGSDAR